VPRLVAVSSFAVAVPLGMRKKSRFRCGVRGGFRACPPREGNGLASAGAGPQEAGSDGQSLTNPSKAEENSHECIHEESARQPGPGNPGGPPGPVLLRQRLRDLVISGTSAGDHVAVSYRVVNNVGYYTVTENGHNHWFAASRVRGGDVFFRGYAGDDFFVNFTGLRTHAWGMDGKDTLIGGSSRDLLDGGAGDDRLYGRGGDDILFGGSGNDSLNGGGGSDHLYQGGWDSDTLVVIGADGLDGGVILLAG